MDLDEALRNLQVACESFRGTLAEHQALQASMALVAVKCRPAPAMDKKPDGPGGAAVQAPD